MSDLSFRDFLGYAEQLYDEATDTHRGRLKMACIIASILESWLAVEACVNSMMNDYAALPGDVFSVHERGFLTEKQVSFENKGDKRGTFQLTNRDDYKRLEDKIFFLLAKCDAVHRCKKGDALWQRFRRTRDTRNHLTHPKKDRPYHVELADAKDALEVAKRVISVLGKEVWSRKVQL